MFIDMRVICRIITCDQPFSCPALLLIWRAGAGSHGILIFTTFDPCTSPQRNDKAANHPGSATMDTLLYVASLIPVLSKSPSLT